MSVLSKYLTKLSQMTEVAPGDAVTAEETMQGAQPVNAQVQQVQQMQPQADLSAMTTQVPQPMPQSTAVVDSNLGEYSSEGVDGMGTESVAPATQTAVPKTAQAITAGGFRNDGVFRNDGSQGSNPQTVEHEKQEDGLMRSNKTAQVLHQAILKHSASSCGGRKKSKKKDKGYED